MTHATDSKANKGWLLDGNDDMAQAWETLLGNAAGLETLKRAIDKALLKANEPQEIGISDFSFKYVVLKPTTLEETEKKLLKQTAKADSKNKTVKAIIYLFFLFFIGLPLVVGWITVVFSLVNWIIGD